MKKGHIVDEIQTELDRCRYCNKIRHHSETVWAGYSFIPMDDKGPQLNRRIPGLTKYIMVVDIFCVGSCIAKYREWLEKNVTTMDQLTNLLKQYDYIENEFHYGTTKPLGWTGSIVYESDRQEYLSYF